MLFWSCMIRMIPWPPCCLQLRRCPWEADSAAAVHEAGEGRVWVQVQDAGEVVREHGRVRQGAGNPYQLIDLLVCVRARVRAFWIGPSSTREINYLCHVRKPKKTNCVWFECVPLSISLAKFGCTTAPVCSGPSKCKIRSIILSIDRPKNISGFYSSSSS